ncbi:glycosyltransferase family 1 protein [Sphingobacterium sp. JB170]|uniref:glycosyltransferase family 4 protein n=1 Tax=Sphingobacterium sp. JB170 TaxID=1434842 RepID=UPI00097ED52A|nr:glycosyltransferase family 1 protein [Sphingobacterium sp. JB170]SJN49370.1 Glycosyl transferase, group 1 [Sphingobacterium sp. JB170]
MIKVAFFAEILIEDFDGASRTMFQIINRINPAHFSYLFIHGKGPTRLNEHKAVCIPTLNSVLSKEYSISVPAFGKEQLNKTLNNFQPDVIHISTPSLLGFFALRYAQKHNIPVISIYHTNFISYVPYYFRKFSALINPIQRWMRGTLTKFYNACDQVYVPSQSMILQLKSFGVEDTKINLWQRGIDLNVFNPKKRDKSRIQQRTGNNKPNVLFTSRLVWEKNLETLIAIYTRLQKQDIDHNFIIAGDGPARIEMERLMPDAIFLGRLDHQELATVYASSDVFVFTSTSETYGNVVVEAMASGLPCVIADAGGSADLINHRHTGYKCSANNAEDYAIHIKLLLADPELHHVIRSASLQQAQSLDWQKLTEKYFQDIQRLAQQTSRDLIWAAC